jgi:hypothetical protein
MTENIENSVRSRSEIQENICPFVYKTFYEECVTNITYVDKTTYEN